MGGFHRTVVRCGLQTRAVAIASSHTFRLAAAQASHAKLSCFFCGLTMPAVWASGCSSIWFCLSCHNTSYALQPFQRMQLQLGKCKRCGRGVTCWFPRPVALLLLSAWQRGVRGELETQEGKYFICSASELYLLCVCPAQLASGPKSMKK